MKKLLLILCSSLLFITNVNAELFADDMNSTIQAEIEVYGKSGLHEHEMNILKKFNPKSYKYNVNYPNVYIFRGNTCGFCLKAVAYLVDLYNSGVNFNLITYEVYTNEDNYNLLTKVADYMGTENYGLPYIVIGDTPIIGYDETRNEEIINAILNYQDDYIIDIINGEVNYNKLTTTTTTTSTTTTKEVITEKAEYKEVDNKIKIIKSMIFVSILVIFGLMIFIIRIKK